MSFEINWDALTNGPEGDALAETIRAFIHERFQQIELPKLIRSVKVHAFDFGTVAPEIVLKDVCDPLPDFYGDEEDEPESGPISPESHVDEEEPPRRATYAASEMGGSTTADTRGRASTRPITLNTTFPPTSIMQSTLASPTRNPIFPRSSTPAIPGGTSNMSYFHLPLNASLSGAATPLAAVAGGHFGAWPDFHHTQNHFHHNHSTSNLRRQSHHQHTPLDDHNADLHSLSDMADDEKSVEDVQIVARLKYSGDIRLSLTAEILLDYPMPSFVGIPVKLNVTGMTFDGVAVVAYIKSKAHFCFLAPEDADALVGSDDDGVQDRLGADEGGGARRMHLGGLFEDIKVESEIGQKVNGKQVLKNVGRVEKFVLEQVRRIFEQEFVYPSFWTFLV